MCSERVWWPGHRIVNSRVHFSRPGYLNFVLPGSHMLPVRFVGGVAASTHAWRWQKVLIQEEDNNKAGVAEELIKHAAGHHYLFIIIIIIFFFFLPRASFYPNSSTWDVHLKNFADVPIIRTFHSTAIVYPVKNLIFGLFVIKLLIN